MVTVADVPDFWLNLFSLGVARDKFSTRAGYRERLSVPVKLNSDFVTIAIPFPPPAVTILLLAVNRARRRMVKRVCRNTARARAHYGENGCHMCRGQL